MPIKKKLVSEDVFQDHISHFVTQEVICCVSSLIFGLRSVAEQLEEYDEYFRLVIGSVTDESEECPVEIYEHWIVSEYLAEKLRRKGETVEDFLGMTIWGRPCTGQAIKLDSVIREVWTDLSGEVADGKL